MSDGAIEKMEEYLNKILEAGSKLAEENGMLRRRAESQSGWIKHQREQCRKLARGEDDLKKQEGSRAGDPLPHPYDVPGVYARKRVVEGAEKELKARVEELEGLNRRQRGRLEGLRERCRNQHALIEESLMIPNGTRWERRLCMAATITGFLTWAVLGMWTVRLGMAWIAAGCP